jgi:hypothetical protein
MLDYNMGVEDMLGGVVLGGSGSETRGRGFVGVRSMVDGAVKGGGAFFTRLIYTPAARYPWVQPSAPAVTDIPARSILGSIGASRPPNPHREHSG